LVFGVGSAVAADKKRDRKRDGSCQSQVITEKSTMDLAADQKRDRKRDRKRDGSCQSQVITEKSTMDLAADQKRDRKRDGSCRNSMTIDKV
jgi:uncharacterized membrane protein